MYCPNCGTKVNDNAHFCSKCGVQLNGVRNKNTVEADKQTVEPTETSEQGFFHKTSGKVAIVVAAVCVVGVIIGGVILNNTSHEEPEQALVEEEPALTEEELQVNEDQESAEPEAVTEYETINYQITREDSSVKDASGNILIENYYDLVQVDADTEAEKTISDFLQEDYQDYLDTRAWNDIGTLPDDWDPPVSTVETTVTNNAEGIFSVVFYQWLYDGNAGGEELYGLTFSMETGEKLSIRDLTDLSDDELLTAILDAVQAYADENNINEYELFGKEIIQDLTIDSMYNGRPDYQSGKDKYGFAVEDGKLLLLFSSGIFTREGYTMIQTDIPVSLN